MKTCTVGLSHEDRIISTISIFMVCLLVETMLKKISNIGLFASHYHSFLKWKQKRDYFYQLGFANYLLKNVFFSSYPFFYVVTGLFIDSWFWTVCDELLRNSSLSYYKLQEWLNNYFPKIVSNLTMLAVYYWVLIG